MSSHEEDAVSLEGALRRLEQIVGTLERDDLDLERALALFEEGVTRIRAAQRIISETELHVQRLLADREGPYLEDVSTERL